MNGEKYAWNSPKEWTRHSHFIILQAISGSMKKKCLALMSPSRPKRESAPRRELLAGNVGRRASFPIRSSLSIQAKFHNLPVNLPPPPTASIHQKVMAEHSYS